MVAQRSMLRERCLLDLATGNSSAADFIEQAQGPEIDLLAPWYQVLVIRAQPRAGAPAAPLYTMCQHVDAIIADVIGDTNLLAAQQTAIAKIAAERTTAHGCTRCSY